MPERSSKDRGELIYIYSPGSNVEIFISRPNFSELSLKFDVILFGSTYTFFLSEAEVKNDDD